jgi:hypothetical protein
MTLYNISVSDDLEGMRKALALTQEQLYRIGNVRSLIQATIR